MIDEHQRLSSNKLLARLAEQEPTFDLDIFESVDCPLKMLLAAPEQAISHVYFLGQRGCIGGRSVA